MKHSAVWWPGMVVLTLGCVGAGATPMVRVRASEDLVCAESTIRVQRELDGTYTALGCGKRASYQAVCEGTRCAVSREGEALRSPPPRGPDPGPWLDR
ncbi:MAG: hypothetical protein MUF54_20400 [Polyangiaceae bacterium]|nr:hypothetical protein [Polyangiaceae bacterium]